MAFCALEGDMEMAETFLKSVFAAVRAAVPDDLEFFAKMIEPAVPEIFDVVLRRPFARLTYAEAVAALEKSGAPFQFPPHWGIDLQSEHERWLTEEYCQAPVIVTDYPKEIKAFYMYANDDGRTVRAMDVLAPRLGEIIGGSQREDRPDRLRARLAELGLSEKDYWWYLDLRRFGSVPHSGFGLGFERLVQFMTGMKNIRDVIPFPRTPGNADF
ncbi:MAG: asparagine--tRNA ligase, partial [Planctomycetes bacterium]|nr:asparagine--tRNA ligase [Planctomycetota bacterium]